MPPMPVTSIPAASGVSAVGAPRVESSFQKVFENAPISATRPHASPGDKTRAHPVEVNQAMDRIVRAQRQLDHVLELSKSGRTFSPAELLGFQAQVYRASQELDFAGKVV